MRNLIEPFKVFSLNLKDFASLGLACNLNKFPALINFFILKKTIINSLMLVQVLDLVIVQYKTYKIF